MKHVSLISCHQAIPTKAQGVDDILRFLFDLVDLANQIVDLAMNIREFKEAKEMDA